MEWLAGADQVALNVVLSSVGIQGQGSGVTLLRAKRALDDNVESARVSERWKEREAWVKLRVLVDILTGPLTNALAVGDQYLLRETSEPARESLTTALLLMVFYYGSVLKRPMQPAVMQLRATQALEAYPSNSLVIGVFLEGSKGQGVWGAVRNIVGNKGPRTKDVPRRLAEVWMATWREGQWVNEVERTRSGLANAVDHVRFVLYLTARTALTLCIGRVQVPRCGGCTSNSKFAPSSYTKRRNFCTAPLGSAHTPKVCRTLRAPKHSLRLDRTLSVSIWTITWSIPAS